jgi:hypothetical protein
MQDQIKYPLEDRIWFDAQVPNPAIVGEVKAITGQMHDALTIGPADLLYLAQMSGAQPKFTPEQEEAWAAYEVARRAYHAARDKPLTVTEAPVPTVRPEGVLFFRGIAFGLLFTAGIVAVVLFVLWVGGKP